MMFGKEHKKLIYHINTTLYGECSWEIQVKQVKIYWILTWFFRHLLMKNKVAIQTQDVPASMSLIRKQLRYYDAHKLAH